MSYSSKKSVLYNHKELEPLFIQFTSLLNRNRKLSTSSGTSSKGDKHGIINRYFPNTDGEVRCKKGFAYDIKKVLNNLCFAAYIQH
jgi:hypothetical protein